MLADIRRVLVTVFSKGERVQMAWLGLVVVAMGLVEMVGIASILPFLAVVMNPTIIETNPYLSYFYRSLGFDQTREFLFWLGVAVLVVLVVNSLISAGGMWLLLRFINLRGQAMSARLLSRYLGQPYVFFLNRNSSELLKYTIDEVNRFVNGVALPVLGALVKTVSIVFILALLIAVDPVMAVSMMAVLGVAYWLLFRSIRRTLSRIGRECFEAATERYKVAAEGFGGIKDLKIVGREAEHVQRYAVPSLVFAKHETTQQLLAVLPRYALESVAFGGVLTIVLYLIASGREAATIVPVVSLYALAGYRLIPAVQQVFVSVANVRYNRDSIELLCRDLGTLPKESLTPIGVRQGAPIVPKRDIAIAEVTYQYPGAERPVFDGVSLNIPAHRKVGIVGPTGSGKSTLIDLLLGLLTPGAGRLMVDGVAITTANVRQWQQSVGYVAQQVYLSDNSIAHNIAFAVPDNEIERDAVVRAAQVANLHEFVRELPAGYDTIVGDRGVRLSGGQRQRIAIARALYHDPDVVVLDEATSAVDGATEAGIMDAIQSLSGRTLIIVAHRLSTVKQCDEIYVLERGEIVGHGTYDELIADNAQFRKIANVS